MHDESPSRVFLKWRIARGDRVIRTVPPYLPSLDAPKVSGMKNLVISIAALTVLATGALLLANNQDASAQNVASDATKNPFAGKAVIITATPGVAGAPKQNIRIERLGGREYLVFLAETDNGETYDYWRAMDEISRIRVFETMDAATTYYESRREKGVFH
jgi:hypothetical protein